MSSGQEIRWLSKLASFENGEPEAEYPNTWMLGRPPRPRVRGAEEMPQSNQSREAA
jgi:hypothetical protein